MTDGNQYYREYLSSDNSSELVSIISKKSVCKERNNKYKNFICMVKVFGSNIIQIQVT